MKKIYLLLISFGFILQPLYSQTVVWSETFEGGTGAAGSMASAYSSANGNWSVTNTGANGADANTWYVSGAECGNTSGACGSGCGTTDASLHIGSSPTIFGDVGASYAAGGLGFFFVETDKRVESPVINLTGQSNLSLTFNYLEDYTGQSGYDPIDDATLWYFDGTTWSQLDPLAITPAGCAPQGTWTAFSIALPASANNNPNVQIGFHWFNNDDNVGTDPSFAVDDIEITTPATSGPTSDFSVASTTICEGDCINFTDNSTAGSSAITNWDWTFTGGTPATSTNQNPANICFNTAGSYNITLTVTDGNGDTDDTTIQITVNNCNLPVASFAPSSTTLCEGDCITLNENSTAGANGPNNSWTWTVAPSTGAPAISNVQNPGTICWNTAGTYDITLSVSDGTDSDDTTIQITVNNCSGPTASFIPSNTSLCEGDCINFTDNSTAGASAITNWDWTFTGGIPGTSGNQNPNNICFNTAGTFNITLTVTDGNSITDDTTVQITVTACSTPGAAFNVPGTLCVGECYDFTDLSTGNPTSWEWTFGGGNPSSSTDQDPSNVCFNTAGSFIIELIASNSNGSDTISQSVTVTSPPSINAGVDVTLNVGESIMLNPSGPAGTYVWSPATGLDCSVCLNPTASPLTSTTYTVTVTDANGCSASDDITVFINIVEGIGIPNAFSPNGDGNNDILYVLGAGIEKLNLKIYNRYGQKVFETTDKTIGWDGTHNGKELNPGVFVFVLEYNFHTQETETLEGTITLMK